MKPLSPFLAIDNRTSRRGTCRLGRKRTLAERGGVMESMKNLDGGSEEDERVGIEKRIEALQRLVPGGESLDPERLFEETADYIMALQEQVHAMKILASFFAGLEKEKTKVGG